LFLFVMVLVLTRRSLADGVEKQRLEGEMAAARTVQQLLVSAPPVSTEYRVEAVYHPAQEVGGDFYWMREDGAGGVLVITGDVSGKGLPAAMLVSLVIGALRRERSNAPAEVLAGLNEALVGQTGGAFVTACCVRLARDGDVTAATAGHPAPYIAGQEIAMEAGLPLGVLAEVEYSETSVRLGPGESLTLVSDGVVEATATRGELFGFDRTKDLSRGEASEIAEAARAWGQNDDITVVQVRRAAA
jgi:serine phosphatase RsbU (regulator of sigma subunit)